MLRVVPGSQKTMTPPIRVTGLFGEGTNGSLRISSMSLSRPLLRPKVHGLFCRGGNGCGKQLVDLVEELVVDFLVDSVVWVCL